MQNVPGIQSRDSYSTELFGNLNQIGGTLSSGPQSDLLNLENAGAHWSDDWLQNLPTSGVYNSRTAGSRNIENYYWHGPPPKPLKA